MFTEQGLLYENANLTVAGSGSLNVNGAGLNVGNSGLSRNSQFVAIVQKADANRALTFTFQLSLDGTNYNYEVGKIVVPANFRGQWAVQASVPEFVWEKYPSANIFVRVNVSAPTNAAASDWDAVRCYLTEGEATIAGRQATADTIQV